MIIRTVEKERDYTLIENSTLTDTSISFRAKGILVYLLSKSKNWTVILQDLIKQSPKEGRDAIRSALDELRKAKYAYLFSVRDPSTKQLKGTQWVVFEVPTEIKKDDQWLEEATPRDGFSGGRPRYGFSESRENPSVGESTTTKDRLITKEGQITKETPIVPKGDECDPASPSPEELIYLEYPVKAGKPNALRAIKRAMKEHKFEYLLAKTKEYAEIRGGNTAFVPYPATWFNQERFNDSPSTWYPDGSKATAGPTVRKGAPCEENNWTTAAW